MTREEFISLRDFIYEKTGIFFAENKMYLLENRLSNRLNELGFETYNDYYFFLKYGNEDAKKELIYLIDVVTTNETSFFRNPPQLDAFKIIMQKNYFNNSERPTMPLKIWSAACSTGEEPYTLAIILLELMELTKKNIPFIIYATDISYRVLEAAKKGVYSPYSIRGVDQTILNKYFTKNGDNYIVKDIVKKNVKFDFMNLIDKQAYIKYRFMDIIFCRNVLIYFDDKAKKRVIDSLYECLKPGGVLTIGHAESLHNISRAFKPIMFPGSIVYLKG